MHRHLAAIPVLCIAVCCLLVAPALASDIDGDGVADTDDNCLQEVNAPLSDGYQCDADHDGYGNLCDCDLDDDGDCDDDDSGLWLGAYQGTGDPNERPEADMNCDGVYNAQDFNAFRRGYDRGYPGPSGLPCAGTSNCDRRVDLDLDGVVNEQDNCVEIPNPDQRDPGGDGFGIACDADQNHDGVHDEVDFEIFLCGLKQFELSGSVVVDDLDYVENQFINLQDFTRFKQIYQGSLSPGPSGSEVDTVPTAEPDDLEDSDGDGLANYVDNCSEVPSADPADQWDEENGGQGDGFGRICDPDYDGDGTVDSDDYDIFLAAHGSSSGDSNYDPQVDHVFDGTINVRDYVVFVQYYGGPPGPSGRYCWESVEFAISPYQAHHRLEPGGTRRGSASLPSLPFQSGNVYSLITPPTAGQVELDAQSGAFEYVHSGGPAPAIDSFSVGVENGATSTSGTVQVELEIWDPAEAPFTAGDLSSEVLVVYNENLDGAESIAQHYVTARGIDSNRLCSVKMPVGLYATKAEMLSARAQILDGCICALIPQEDWPPAGCGTADPEATALVSPINHLVLVKGMPARVYETGWSTDYEEPSLDFYLSYYLARDATDFESCVLPPCETPPLISSSLYPHRYARALDVGVDRFLAYGHLEAITVDRTLDLIDRTLEAERAGFTGSTLAEGSTSRSSPTVGYHIGYAFNELRERTSSFVGMPTEPDPCVAYVTEGGDWPAPQPGQVPACRAGTTYTEVEGRRSSDIPGEVANNGVPLSSIPIAQDAGLFLGDNPWSQSQRGFDRFETLPNWRSDQQCVSSPFQDYFGELGSDVGGACGLIGIQLRSYPVQYYGFQPPDWRVEIAGRFEKSPSRQIAGDGQAYAGAQYLHVGEHDAANPDVPECASGPCPEHIALALVNSVEFSEGNELEVNGSRPFDVSLAHRSQNGGDVWARLNFTYVSGATDEDKLLIVLSPRDPSDPGAWTVSSGTLYAEGTDERISSITIHFYASLQQRVSGYLDLDAIEVVDAQSGAPLLDASVGGFESTTQNRTHSGDFAANAIDRLGAIAWWGSSSHHLTGGWAFEYVWRTAEGFFAGRTLGESVIDATSGQSGIIYGDPLYRPSAAALYFVEGREGQTFSKEVEPQPEPVVVTAENLDVYGHLFMNVLHGTDHLQDVQWQISTCDGSNGTLRSIRECDDIGWTERLSGQGAWNERRIDLLNQVLANPSTDQLLSIRLKVWNPGAEAKALYDFVYVDYRAGT